MDKKTQARLAQHNRPKHPQYAITHNQPGQHDGPVKIDHGHDGMHQYLVLSRPTTHIALTEAQVDQFIAAMQDTKARLAQHKAAGGPVASQGNDSAN